MRLIYTRILSYRGIRGGFLREIDEERLDKMVDEGRELRARARRFGGPLLMHRVAASGASTAAVSGLSVAKPKRRTTTTACVKKIITITYHTSQT